MEPWWKDINRGECPFQCQIVHKKSHVDWPGFEHGPIQVLSLI